MWGGNEIIVHNFRWHNPPQFTESEYFVNVGELSIEFDAMSVYIAITKAGGKSISLNEKYPIKIHHIQLNNARCFIERVNTPDYEGLNLWAALGAENSAESKSEVRLSWLVCSYKYKKTNIYYTYNMYVSGTNFLFKKFIYIFIYLLIG